MKHAYVKVLFFLPFLLFIDWSIMVIFGCFASVCGADDKFYCSVFCKVGIVLLSLTVSFVLVLLIQKRKKPEVK
jgi:hypothetical protein